MKKFMFIRRFSYFDLLAMLIGSAVWERNGWFIGFLALSGLAVASVLLERATGAIKWR